ncbi:unnamed protein product [Trichobilharzia regenti]|nr:unnamed protein product [Trichobilharzia regenti]
MGSPLGPIFANIFLAKLENSLLKEELAKMEMYCRYMDDTFIVYDVGLNSDLILNNFYNAHPVDNTIVNINCAISYNSSNDSNNSNNNNNININNNNNGLINNKDEKVK